MGRLITENAVQTDERKTVYLLPVKVVKTCGEVEDAGMLTVPKKYYQINIRDDDTAVLRSKNGVKAGILLDFGREIHGGVRILCSSTSCGYADMLVRFGESASEAMSPLGEKNATNDHAVREFTVPVPPMSDQTWGQSGFRFVYLELLNDDAEIDLKCVLAAFSYRDLDYKGSFRCNDELINKIFEVSAYTCHLCLQNYLWDGIKRDRLVWIGDSHPEMLTTQTVFGRLKVFEESIDEARDAYPLPDWINTMPSYSLWWMIIVHDQYIFNGDREYLNANLGYLEGITEQVTSCIDENGSLNLPSYFIDWPNHDTPAEKEGVKALCVPALKKAAALLEIAGNTSLSEKAQNAAVKLLEAGADCSGSKSTEALAYLSGFDSKEHTAEILTKNGAKGVSTFFSYYILKALFDSGRKTEALEIMKEYYGAMLDMGATSFWEDFNIEWTENSAPIDRLPEPGERDIHGDFGGFCYVNFRHSLCHGWSSGPAPFLIRHILGINVSSNDNKITVTIKPDLCGLQFAEGSHALPDGKSVFVRVRNENGKIITEYIAPDGVEVLI